MGRNAFPTQNPIPGHSPAPWHPSRGPGALAGTTASVPVSAVRLGQACEGVGGWILHLPCDRGNRISSFKQHLKYSLGDPKAKCGMACEVPSLDLLMPF